MCVWATFHSHIKTYVTDLSFKKYNDKHGKKSFENLASNHPHSWIDSCSLALHSCSYLAIFINDHLLVGTYWTASPVSLQ